MNLSGERKSRVTRVRSCRLCWLAVVLSSCIALFVLSMPAAAAMIEVVPPSPFTGPTQTKPGFSSPQGDYRPFDITGDLAFQGGSALAAVAKDEIPGFTNIHLAQYANDGFYGNGASWIGISTNTWLKIDLGQTAMIDSVIFGRDRLSGFNDRDPGQFLVEVALTDNVYAMGDDTNDGSEYSLVFDSSTVGYSGAVNGTESLRAVFDSAVSARYVKMTFTNSGTAIDEIQINQLPATAPVPEPTSLAIWSLISLAGAGWGFRRRRSEGSLAKSKETP